MSKHTPGPWRVDERDRVSHGAGFEEVGPFVVLAPDDADGRPVVLAVLEDDGEPGQAKADAHVMAAAPDLLAALKAIVENEDAGRTATFWTAKDGIANAGQPVNSDAARAAIARAETQP
jgi:hypothetical protein